MGGWRGGLWLEEVDVKGGREGEQVEGEVGGPVREFVNEEAEQCLKDKQRYVVKQERPDVRWER